MGPATDARGNKQPVGLTLCRNSLIRSKRDHWERPLNDRQTWNTNTMFRDSKEIVNIFRCENGKSL